MKGTVKSVLVDDEIVKINLSLYDTDSMASLANRNYFILLIK